MKDRRLTKDLRAQGASSNEAKNLASLASQLTAVKPRGLSARAKQRLYNQLPFDEPKERPVFRWAMAGSLVGAMALLALVFLPGMLRTESTQPEENDVRTLVQPIETELQQLDMQVEELQQQPTINEAELKEAEKRYQRKFEDFRRRYQDSRQFRNYDWNKWQRTWQRNDDSDSRDSSVNGASSSFGNYRDESHR